MAEDGSEEWGGLHLRELVGKLMGMGDMLLAVYMLGLKHRPKKVGAEEKREREREREEGGSRGEPEAEGQVKRW